MVLKINSLMTRRTPPIPYSQLPAYEEPVQLIDYNNRTPDGIYEIPPGVTHIHPFAVPYNNQIRIVINHINRNEQSSQSFALRSWISFHENGEELFYRFHPDSGGISHVFYDKDIASPEIECNHVQQNHFSVIKFQRCDIPVGFLPGIYYYHILNMENRPNAYRINFARPVICCPDGTVIVHTTWDLNQTTFDINSTIFT